MQVKIKTKTLASALERMQPLTSRRTTLPVLSCVLIQAVSGGITVTTSWQSFGESR